MCRPGKGGGGGVGGVAQARVWAAIPLEEGQRDPGPRPGPGAGAAEGTGREFLGGRRGCGEDPGVGVAAPPSCG